MPTRDEVEESWYRLEGNVTAMAREFDVNRKTIYDHLKRAGINRTKWDGKVKEQKIIKKELPKKGKIKRYIITSAQNNTYLHNKVWKNLIALKNYYSAELLVGTFSYNLNAYGSKSTKRGKEKEKSKLWYAEGIKPFIVDQRVELAPNLIWCGEMNILPTAKRPLSGLETYTQTSSGIFPHVKFAMDSIPSLIRGEPTKFNYTTGCVTKRNYIQKKQGIQAEFHHSYGAVIVEVNHKGVWWVRQLGADNSGKIYDLNIYVQDEEIKKTEYIESITWGDVHVMNLDPSIENICWGEDGILDTLKPKKQFIHDLLAGKVINHHSWNDAHEQFKLFVEDKHKIETEMSKASDFLKHIHRNYCNTYIVWSNHDSPWIQRWLNECDYRKDPANALYFLRLQLALYESIANGTDHDFHLLKEAMRAYEVPKGIRFLGPDDSQTVYRGQIECAVHGHLGPNGTRGTPLNLSKMGKKANTAHTHSACIIDGLYVAGTSTELDWRYARGPSSWSHSLIITYPNGKRTIVTIFDGKWKATA